MGGSSPQATPIQLSPGAPPKPPPGYGFAKSFFEQVAPQLFNMPLPSYGGQVDPGLSPTMQNLIRGAQTYSQSPFPQSLEQASGTLGAFQNFDKLPGANFQYQMDPSHESMYAFQRPSLERPQNPFGSPPDYGFNVQPQTQMAEGGGGGYGSEKIVGMLEGGGGGVEQGPGGYWWDSNGGLAFNPNEGGRLGDSRWGSFWNWVQGQTGFTPGQQHGPNAQFWDAIPPAGLDYGRGGAVDPTDLTDPGQTGYGWWNADPNSDGMQMPPWLAGLNDEEMAWVFDLVGNIPPGMRQPLDTMGQQLVGEQLMDWGGPSARGGGGGGRGGGGGGGGVPINFQGIPGYQPTEVNSSFVGWDPGNPTPSLVPGNPLMPPETPEFFFPPPAPPPGGSGGNGGGGGMPPGPPGGGPPRPQDQLPPQMGPPSMPPPFPFLPQGPRGMFRPGNQGPGQMVAPETRPVRTDEGYVHLPMMAEGNVVDHPQLAMIGEAGPEVVLPLTRPAKDEGIRKMQEILGLPVTGMQYGGGAGFGRPRPQTPGMPPPGGGMTAPPPAPQGQTGGGLPPGMGWQPPSFNDTYPGSQKPAPTMGPSPPGSPQPVLPPGLRNPPSRQLPGGGGTPQLGRTTPPSIGRSPGDMPSQLGQKPATKPGFPQLGQKPAAKPGFNPPGDLVLGQKPAQKPGAPPTDPVLGQKPAPAPGQGPASRSDPDRNMLPAGVKPGTAGGVGFQPPWQPQQNGMTAQDPFGPTSAMDVFRSAVPVMNDVMQQQIQGALAQAGMTGNRFGTSTERNVADIGRQAGNQLTNQMGKLLYGQTQADLDRALEATGMGLADSRFRNQLGFQGQQNALDRAMQAAGMGGQFAQIQDQMAQDRLRLPFQIGAWEQGRQDQFARLPYDEFMQSRLGFMPDLFQLIMSQGGAGGMSPQFGVQQTGGSPGALDYISALAPIFMGMLAEGGAAGESASKIVGGY